MTAQCALFTKKVFGKLLVDNDDLRVLVNIAGIEVAAFEYGNSHRLEKAGRRRIHESLYVFAVFRLVTFDSHRTIPLVAVKKRHGRETRVLNSGILAKSLEKVSIKVDGAR